VGKVDRAGKVPRRIGLRAARIDEDEVLTGGRHVRHVGLDFQTAREVFECDVGGLHAGEDRVRAAWTPVS
jgi:hypothetical protein